MRSLARVWLLVLVCGLVLAVAVLRRRRRSGSKSSSPRTAKKKNAARKPPPPNPGRSNSRSRSRRPNPVEEAEEEGFTQAGGRVPFGVTDFLVASVGNYPEKVPTAATTHIRTDVAPGPRDEPVRSRTLLADGLRRRRRCVAAGAAGLFEAPNAECEESEIGLQEATIYTGKFVEGGPATSRSKATSTT